MSGIFGGVIEALRQASVFALRRHELLAENVANADTPGFRAHDLSFAHELDLAQLVRSRPEPGYGPGMDLRMVDTPDGPAKLDGNDVDLDKEMARIGQNALYHNVVIQLLNARFNALKSAINGR
jgi:flagellar basal-body rod protein FlgB